MTEKRIFFEAAGSIVLHNTNDIHHFYHNDLNGFRGLNTISMGMTQSCIPSSEIIIPNGECVV